MPSETNSVLIGMIGFGEVGTTFSRAFLAAGGYDVAMYDILLDDPSARNKLLEKARSVGVRPCGSVAEAMAQAAVVISAVTAGSAVAVAEAAGKCMQPGQIFLDINSVSPATKRHDAELVERSGADYVEAAVMAPVAPHGLQVPIVLGGTQAARLKALLEPAGTRMEVGDAQIGKASALKMCRSVMVKGLEALAVECFTTARLHGIEDKILASLSESYPGIDWEKFAGYKIGRVVEHGRRRAAEMREAAETVGELGFVPVMSRAIAERIDWVAELVEREPAIKQLPDKQWRTMIDAFARLAPLRAGQT